MIERLNGRDRLHVHGPIIAGNVQVRRDKAWILAFRVRGLKSPRQEMANKYVGQIAR
jgi:hypothetical protein